MTKLSNLYPVHKLNLDSTPMPDRRAVIGFIHTDQPAERGNWWLIVEPGQEVDLCSVDPGYEVDLYVETDLRCMMAIWMGLTTVGRSTEKGQLPLSSEKELADTMQKWLGLSPFAAQKRHAD